MLPALTLQSAQWLEQRCLTDWKFWESKEVTQDLLKEKCAPWTFDQFAREVADAEKQMLNAPRYRALLCFFHSQHDCLTDSPVGHSRRSKHTHTHPTNIQKTTSLNPQHPPLRFTKARAMAVLNFVVMGLFIWAFWDIWKSRIRGLYLAIILSLFDIIAEFVFHGLGLITVSMVIAVFQIGFALARALRENH